MLKKGTPGSGVEQRVPPGAALGVWEQTGGQGKRSQARRLVRVAQGSGALTSLFCPSPACSSAVRSQHLGNLPPPGFSHSRRRRGSPENETSAEGEELAPGTLGK